MKGWKCERAVNKFWEFDWYLVICEKNLMLERRVRRH